MEAGGYATTWSMRFQYLWAVKQLLQLLAEELRSVRIEPAGEEGEGVDLIVTLADGSTEYQQCKRSQRMEGRWTLGALNARGVLGAIRDRLQADPEASYCLVSVDPAPELRELSESARASLGPVSFYDDQVRASANREQAFNRFCAALRLDPKTSGELAEAHELLSRTYTVVVDDNQVEVRELASTARYWIDSGEGADAGTVVRAMESWAAESLRRAITAEDLSAFLRSCGYEPRQLPRDPRIRPTVERLRESFERPLRHQLLQGRLLPRDETRRIETLLTEPSGPRFIAVHGSAGVGKSGVLLELAGGLKNCDVPYLPIRFDHKRPTGTTRQFGASLGLPESPALCLEALSGGDTAVLILDQLDALRWTGSQASQALDTCRELVEEALRFPNLRIVACCRTFDLESDPQIRGWLEEEKAQKVPVDRLSRESVKEVVSMLGVDPQDLTSRQVDLLQTIQHLRTWEEVVSVTGVRVDFRTEQELLDEFWRSRLRQAAQMGLDPETVAQAVEQLVSHMDQEGVLTAPRRLLRESPIIEEALRSLNVIAVTDNEISFSHQTYLDHHLANFLLKRIDQGDESVEGWLAAAHQSLYRREQLRLILGMLRGEKTERYLSTVRSLIGSAGLRFHLKQLVLQFLGQVEIPTPGEVRFALSLLAHEYWQEHVVADVISGHPRWFEAADRAGFLVRWLAGEESEVDVALRLISSVSDKCGETCHKLLTPLVEQTEGWATRVAKVLPLAPAKDSPSLFELRLKLIEDSVEGFHFDWEGLGGSSLTCLVRLLMTILSSLSDTAPTLRRSSSMFHGLGAVNLEESSFSELLEAWEALVPEVNQLLMVEVAGSGLTIRTETHGWQEHLQAFLRNLTQRLVSQDAPAILDLLDEEPNRLGELLVLEALAGLEDRTVADQALDWLISESRRLSLRWSGSELPWELSRRAVEQLARYASDDMCSAFEEFALSYIEPQLRKELEWRHEELLFPSDRRSRFRATLLARPTPAGQTAYHLLPCLLPDRLSANGRRSLMALSRKFEPVDHVYFAGAGEGGAGTVGSPLPHDRLHELSDNTWLEIIARNTTAPSQAPWRRGREGGFEVSSPRTFAQDLQTATARQPRRFVRLALRFPVDANPVYFRAVLQGLRAGSGDEQHEGESATPEELEAFLALPPVISDPESAISIARLIEGHSDLQWSSTTLSRLAKIAVDHPHPGDDERVIGRASEDWDPQSLMENALNCTRGAAAYAISSLLFADERRLEAFSTTIKGIANDPHPAVRAAALPSCLAALDPAPDQAIAWALEAAEGHEAMLACGWFDRFLLYASRRYPDEIEPTLHRMLCGEREDVVRVAASHAVALYFLTGRMSQTAVRCVHGSPPERAAAAQVSAAFASSPDHHQEARAMLLDLVDDDEDEVLEHCADVFRDASLEQFDADFLNSFAASRTFSRHPAVLLFNLRDHSGSLVPLERCVLSLCRSFAETKATDPDVWRGVYWQADRYLPPILLRLYEQAENVELRERCLDAWDVLLESRTVSAMSVLRELEADQ